MAADTPAALLLPYPSNLLGTGLSLRHALSGKPSGQAPRSVATRTLSGTLRSHRFCRLAQYPGGDRRVRSHKPDITQDLQTVGRLRAPSQRNAAAISARPVLRADTLRATGNPLSGYLPGQRTPELSRHFRPRSDPLRPWPQH